MTSGRLRVVYRTREAHTCPRCGRRAQRCDFLGRSDRIIKTYHRCLERFLRTIAFDASHPPQSHGWINLTKGIEQ